MTAIRKHLGDFAAIVAMAVIAIGITAYIVFNQDARPAIPLIEDTPVKMQAEFSDAQAVVPGQGQSVRISGVEVGKIGAVELEDGLAVVTMNIEPDYAARVHQDASALLRPRTGLKDMFVELDPGSSATPPLGENGRIPVQNTAPDVDPDEILAALDSDTRSYLQLLVSGAGKGLDNNGDDLREVFERFEPLHRDLAAVQGAVASRRAALSRLIHNYGELTTELAKNETDLTRLVTASNDVFEAFASEDENISLTVSRLPSALNQTSETLAKVDRLGEVLGPTLDDLRPAFRQLDVANREVLPLVREGEPILRNEIRPFVRTARPYVRDLRPAARNLAQAVPDLNTSFGELNRFFNMFAFNPAPGEESKRRPESGVDPVRDGYGAGDANREEGYLFWLHWVATNGNSVFSTSDASGPFRRVLFQVNCESVESLVEEIGAAFRARLVPLVGEAQAALLGVPGAEALLTIILGQNPVTACIELEELGLAKVGSSSRPAAQSSDRTAQDIEEAQDLLDELEGKGLKTDDLRQRAQERLQGQSSPAPDSGGAGGDGGGGGTEGSRAPDEPQDETTPSDDALKLDGAAAPTTTEEGGE